MPAPRADAPTVTQAWEGAASPWAAGGGATTATDEASRLAWAERSVEVDEPGLTVALLSAPVGQPAPWETTALARALVLTGRAREAIDVLARAGVVPPHAGETPTGAQAVLAGAHAALGDDDAYLWLLGLGARMDERFTGWLARLVAAVADARGDGAIAADAWEQVVVHHGPAAGDGAVVRAAASTIQRRERHGSTEALVGTLVSAVQILAHLQRVAAGAPDPAVRVAGLLVERGDVAGARLLLRAWRPLVPRSPEVEALFSRVTPAAARWVSVAQVVGCLALLAGGVALAATTDSAAPALAAGALMGLWLRYGPVPGFTREEAALDRSLANLRFDPERGVTVHDQNSSRGWYGAAGIAGAIAGFVGAAAFSATPTGQEWSMGAGGAVLWLGVPALAGLAAAWAARFLHVVVLRSAARRRRAADDAARAAAAAACVCWRAAVLVGDVADAYARHHLADGGPARFGGSGRVATCPQTGLPWLTGPLGDDGRWLALRGALPRAESAGEADAGAGFYL